MDIVYFEEEKLSDEEKQIPDELEYEKKGKEILPEEEHCSKEELKDQWRSENRKKAKRLEDITGKVLERMKKMGIFKGSIEHFPNENKPDKIVEKEIGFECKNRDPEKKNVFNKHTVKTQITHKFNGRNWKKKVLVTTKLKIYPRDEEECRKLLEDYIIIELGDFVTEENKDEMEEKLFRELMKRKSEIFG